ncbi:MAG TPA: hypothetical protein VJP76_03580, partial [Candidatus Tumulicola sp.]|nr:hypothetical protein [Candidatus Tumulicola sp.]
DTARRAGFTAYVPGELPQLEFDSLLFSHVLEHMEESAAEALLQAYLPYLKVAGTVVFMTPQEAGFASDPTHVHFTDFDGLSRIARGQRLVPVSMYSFPFPRFAGRFFRYNEFVLIARSLT